MDQATREQLRQLEREFGVTNPIQDYDETTPEGRARMERLREQIQMSKRFTWPSVVTVNV